ncbi:MAG: hypothetical protein M1831_000824 [Alyxoria varia]|nr:MAG: hypothetical protein M1831_000824 [Alyxoria varia]
MPPLSSNQLKFVVSKVAWALDEFQIDYAIMGGAAVCLIVSDPMRSTRDVDLVIHVDARQTTTADQLTTRLLNTYPASFGPIDQYGHTIPGVKLTTGGVTRLVDLEVFDQLAWPNRPQYDIQRASRWTINVNNQPVKVFSPEWMLREKILSQSERSGQKEASDIQDLSYMLDFVTAGKPELNFNDNRNLQAALSTLLQKRPDLAQRLSAVISCTAVFRRWYVYSRILH